MFVVPGTLDALYCDDVIVSTDARGITGVRRHWWRTLEWLDGQGRDERQSGERLSDERRYMQLDPRGRVDGGRSRWLLHVGAEAADGVAWLRTGVRQLLQAVAKSAPSPKGRPRRVALPVVGVGAGGLGEQRGAVVRALLEEAAEAPDALDVIIVAHSRADYSALQAQRRRRAGAVLDGGPYSPSRAASWLSASDHGSRLEPVAASLPSASRTRSGLCGDRLPSRRC